MNPVRVLPEVAEGLGAGQRLDAADPGGQRPLRDDPEDPDFAGAADVGSPAQLPAHAGTVTIRTTSAYFSPKNAIAPFAIASSYGRSSQVTGLSEKTASLTASSTVRRASADPPRSG